MIVVDTNVITYLFMDGDSTAVAEDVLRKDAEWAAPLLWRSEFRNVLAFYIRTQNLTSDNALKVMNEAEQLMADNEYEVTSMDVLKLAETSGCSAYDCEFVALSKDLGIPLVTSDKKIIAAFPEHVFSMERFIGSG